MAIAVVAGALALPAGASAAKVVYGGTTEGGGRVAMDVKVSHKGVPKKITEIRGVDLPATCEQSGPGAKLNARVPVSLKIDKNGEFSFSYTEPTYGNTSSITGKVRGHKLDKLKGTLNYANHYPADAKYPEENCSTGPLKYKVKAAGADVEIPPAV